MNALTPHSPACPLLSGDATPGPFPPTVSIHAGGGAIQEAAERVAFVRERCDALQATYDATRTHKALFELRKGRNALLVSETRLSTLEQEAKMARGGW